MTAFTGLAFTATVRVVNRIHHHTANGWANTHPALHTGLAQTAQAVFFVGNTTNGGAAFDVNLANFTGAHAHLGIGAFTRQQRCRGTSGTRDLRAFADLHLDAVNGGTHGNIADGQGVTDANRRFRTAHQRGTDFKATWGDDVGALAVGVADQGNMGRAVGVVLDTFDLGRNGILVALEVNHAVMMLVTATFVTRRDVPVVVTASLLELRLQQRRVRFTLVQVIPGNLHHATHAW